MELDSKNTSCLYVLVIFIEWQLISHAYMWAYKQTISPILHAENRSTIQMLPLKYFWHQLLPKLWSLTHLILIFFTSFKFCAIELFLNRFFFFIYLVTDCFVFHLGMYVSILWVWTIELDILVGHSISQLYWS